MYRSPSTANHTNAETITYMTYFFLLSPSYLITGARYEVKNVLQSETMKPQGLIVKDQTSDSISLVLEGKYSVTVTFDPVRFDFYNGDTLVVSFNRLVVVAGGGFLQAALAASISEIKQKY